MPASTISGRAGSPCSAFRKTSSTESTGMNLDDLAYLDAVRIDHPALLGMLEGIDVGDFGCR